MARCEAALRRGAQRSHPFPANILKGQLHLKETCSYTVYCRLHSLAQELKVPGTFGAASLYGFMQVWGEAAELQRRIFRSPLKIKLPSATRPRKGGPVRLLYTYCIRVRLIFYTVFYGFLRFSLLNSRFFLRLFPFPETRRITVIRRRTCALTRHVRTYT